MLKPRRWGNSLIIAAPLLAVMVACSSTSVAETEPDARSATAAPGPTTTARSATPSAPFSAKLLRVALASSDLAVGPNRFAFGVLDEGRQPVRVPSARVSFISLEPSAAGERFKATALFRRWPTGQVGVYTTDAEFSHPGRWGVEIELITADGNLGIGKAAFTVRAVSAAPGIGKAAPPSRNPVAADVEDLKEITSSSDPDPDLYQITIEDAVASGLPTLVTFSTPAFCQTATCGPQVELVSSIEDEYSGRANFIHVEVYENPIETQEDFSKRRLSPLMEEWGLQIEPFTFILDSEGKVAYKFEGFASEEELVAALAEVVTP